MRPPVTIDRIRAVVVNVTKHTNWIFVVVDTREGVRGVGEATLIGHETEVSHAVDQIGAALGGRDTLSDVTATLPRHGGDIYAAAWSGVEQALWDIRARACNVPVRVLLGGGREAVPVYANFNRGTTDRSPAGFAARAREAVGAGFRALKCAPFDEFVWWETPGRPELLDTGIARVAAVREAVGPGMTLMVDCHWRFDLATAVEVGQRLRPLGLSWYEAPVSERDPDAIRQVRMATGLRIAGGELQTNLADYRVLCEARCLDILMPDVKYVGGIGGLLKVAALAEAFGVGIAPHNPSGPVATAATLHAAAVIPSLVTVEYQFAEAPWTQDLVHTEFTVRDGEVLVPAGPGLGVSLDLEVAARHPYRPVTHMQDPRLR